MFAKYSYLAGITAAQLLADLVALCTGTTDPAALSAGCDKPNTVIMAGITPAGWSVFDAAAGTNKVCITAPCKEEPARLKYVVIDTNTAGSVFRPVYESWNAGAHVGSNLAYSSNNSGDAKVSAAVPGTIYLHVTPRHLVMWGTYTGAPFAAPSWVMECDTAFSWCAPGQGFTPAGFFGSTGWFPPRFVGKNGVTSTSGSSAYCTVYAFWGSLMGVDANFSNGVPMAGGTYGIPVSVLWGDISGGSSAATPVVSGFSNSDLLACFSNAALGDEFTYNGQTYVMLPMSSAAMARGNLMLLKG